MVLLVYGIIISMEQLTLQEFESHLWKSADILRGSVDSGDFSV